MGISTATILAMTAVCLAAVATVPAGHAATQRHTVTVKHAPISNPGDVSKSWDARQYVIESKQYEQLLRTNPTFRQARMRKECGSITDPQLHQSCLASFNQDGPYLGSSKSPPRYRSNAGR